MVLGSHEHDGLLGRLDHVEQQTQKHRRLVVMTTVHKRHLTNSKYINIDMMLTMSDCHISLVLEITCLTQYNNYK